MLLLALGLAGLQESPEYTVRERRWREEVQSSLTQERGWLSVAGLFWLSAGDSTIGSEESMDIVLPKGAAPDRVGTVSFRNREVVIAFEPGVEAKVDGGRVRKIAMVPDSEGAPTRVQIGRLTMTVIKRGLRTGIRLYDAESEARRRFRGLSWFPVDPKYRIRARYVAYPKPRQLAIINVLGDVSPSENPGYVLFELGGREIRLEAESAGSGLFFNFRDTTNGHQTYPAGRFLDAEAPKNGFVTLDFNRATNPPCAFTRFATCPLAPAQNRMLSPVPAGEKAYHL